VDEIRDALTAESMDQQRCVAAIWQGFYRGSGREHAGGEHVLHAAFAKSGYDDSFIALLHSSVVYVTKHGKLFPSYYARKIWWGDVATVEADDSGFRIVSYGGT
jgi:hypothetical protein